MDPPLRRYSIISLVRPPIYRYSRTSISKVFVSEKEVNAQRNGEYYDN